MMTGEGTNNLFICCWINIRSMQINLFWPDGVGYGVCEKSFKRIQSR